MKYTTLFHKYLKKNCNNFFKNGTPNGEFAQGANMRSSDSCVHG